MSKSSPCLFPALVLVALTAACGGTNEDGSQSSGGSASGGSSSGGGSLGGRSGATTNQSSSVGGVSGGTHTAIGGSSNGVNSGTQAALGSSSSRATGGTEPTLGGSSNRATGGTQPTLGGSSNRATGGTQPSFGGAPNGGSNVGSGGLGSGTGGTTGPVGTFGGATGGGAQIQLGGSSSAPTGGTRTTLGGSAASGGLSGNAGGTTSSASGTGGTAGGAQTALGGTSAQACPDSSAYVGNSGWKQQLQVKAGATYCSGWSGSQTLEQMLASKAKLHLAEGTYALPDNAGSYSFALPVCFEFPAGAQAPRFSGAGQITQKQSTFAPDVYYTDSFSQPLTSTTPSDLSFEGDFSFTSTVGVPPASLVFDGSGLVGENTFQGLYLCTSGACTWFDSCNPETYRLNRSTVTFDGGQVVFDVRITALPGGITESPVFVLASGTLDSVTFEQRDYWKLVYTATHHQFERSFAVLFDTPIGGACGIKVTTLDPYNGSQLPLLQTIHCDLSNIAERNVTGAVTQMQ